MGRYCRALRNVNARTHRPGANDVGHTLSVAVRAIGAHGSTQAFASLVGPIAGAQPNLDSLAQPVVAGSAVQGGTVRVDTGAWQPKPSAFAYQWARCNAELRACIAIGGETGETHDVGAGDLGHVLVAIVQARSGATSRAVFSTATALAVASGGGGKGPSIATAPVVAEVLQQGNVLTGSIGSWSGSGSIAYAYSWYRCDASGAQCKTIRRATKSTHLLGARDVGHTLGFAVHATDSGGTATAYAPLLGPVAAADVTLVSTGQPAISGTAAPGQALQVSSGSWSQPPTALAYQWQRCNANGRLCAPIGGATAATYTATADDAGHRLLAVVHATAGAAAQDALSGATAVVTALAPAPPPATGPPTVAGTAEAGSQLTGSGAPGTYNWFRCDASGAHCLSIHGATNSSYTEGAKDVGQTLGFAVHAADGTTAYAPLVGPVAPAHSALASTTQPAITGTAAPGQVLQASSGSWSNPPSALAYQWQRCNANGRLCSPIAGATASTFTAAAADSGHTLLVVVTGSLNGVDQPALSTHTAVVP
jgi:hypothetical protein